MRFANEINSYRVGLTYFDVNFGTVLIDWEPADPVVRLQVRAEKGEVVLQQRLTLSQLRVRPSQPPALLLARLPLVVLLLAEAGDDHSHRSTAA